MKAVRHLLVAIPLAVATAAALADERPYSAAAFTQLTQAGQEVVVDVHADWCPTCRRQQPVLEGLVKTDKYKKYTILVLDFDTQTQALQQFHVAQQSTLIVFHGREEMGRATGITESSQIAALLDKGL
jgi:thioredoxin 1